jgi:hypothetical protein
MRPYPRGMRSIVTVLVAVVVCGAAFYLWPPLPAAAPPVAAAPDAPDAPAEVDPQPPAEASLLQVAQPVREGTEPAPAQVGPRTLDGTVHDRFAQPVRGERVWLLDQQQGHPSQSAVFADYITGTTSSSGVFSLTLPDEGTYRLAVGPPGEQRLPPSEPFELTGRPRAEVVIPGGTAVCVTFDQVPGAEQGVTLELMTLRELGDGRADGRGFGGERNRGFGDGRDGRGGGDRGDRSGGGRGRGPGGAEGDGAEGRGGRRGGGDGARQVAFVQDDQGDQDGQERQDGPGREGREGRPGLQDQADRRGGGGRRGRDGEGGVELPPNPAEPREFWRAAVRHTLSEEELDSGVVNLVGIPPGREARLDLRLGRRRIEGVGRFHVAADIQVNLRVLPVPQDLESGLSYIVTTRPIDPNAARVGVRWEH